MMQGGLQVHRSVAQGWGKLQRCAVLVAVAMESCSDVLRMYVEWVRSWPSPQLPLSNTVFLSA